MKTIIASILVHLFCFSLSLYYIAILHSAILTFNYVSADVEAAAITHL